MADTQPYGQGGRVARIESMIRRKQSRSSSPQRESMWLAAFAITMIMAFSPGVSGHATAQPLARGQTKFVGHIVGSGFNIRSDFPLYWNQVTAENAGKWGSVESSPGVYNWTELDNIYNIALSNSFRYKHHNLVWGQQQPSFMTTLDSAQQYQEIVNWFMVSGQRYLSAAFCDVVNEPLHAPPPYKNALGGNGATGWDWVIRAFELARQYWPYTKLHINEYSVLNDNTANAQYLQVINLLRARGLLDGIGVQGHRFEVENAALSTLQTNLNNLTATGLPVYITEFDLGNISNSGTPNDSVQLALYRQRFPVLWENPGVKGITLWGYVQNAIWQTTAYLLRSDGTERPALRWLRTYLATPLPPGLVSPVGVTDVPRNALLVWRSSALARSYRIQVALNSSFSTLAADTTVSDTLLRLHPLAANTMHYWHVSASDDSGVSAYSATASFLTGDQIDGVPESRETPLPFSLSQNYPNPFNPSTRISYQIPARGWVSLKVYDVLGREVATLVDEEKLPGSYEVTFPGAGRAATGDGTVGAASGVYFYRLQSGGLAQTRKLLLLR